MKANIKAKYKIGDIVSFNLNIPNKTIKGTIKHISFINDIEDYLYTIKPNEKLMFSLLYRTGKELE